jgi:hypothetical protein
MKGLRYSWQFSAARPPQTLHGGFSGLGGFLRDLTLSGGGGVGGDLRMRTGMGTLEGLFTPRGLFCGLVPGSGGVASGALDASSDIATGTSCARSASELGGLCCSPGVSSRLCRNTSSMLLISTRPRSLPVISAMRDSILLSSVCLCERR